MYWGQMRGESNHYFIYLFIFDIYLHCMVILFCFASILDRGGKVLLDLLLVQNSQPSASL